MVCLADVLRSLDYSLCQVLNMSCLHVMILLISLTLLHIHCLTHPIITINYPLLLLLLLLKIHLSTDRWEVLNVFELILFHLINYSFPIVARDFLLYHCLVAVDLLFRLLDFGQFYGGLLVEEG